MAPHARQTATVHGRSASSPRQQDLQALAHRTATPCLRPGWLSAAPGRTRKQQLAGEDAWQQRWLEAGVEAMWALDGARKARDTERCPGMSHHLSAMPHLCLPFSLLALLPVAGDNSHCRPTAHVVCKASCSTKAALLCNIWARQTVVMPQDQELDEHTANDQHDR